ncbi:MAG TPA: hypothetical protein VHV10_17225 [Ktedonobacteraceae bacterium]|jgi:hypothetical protein|nr:hypothetical protein [Ktedonobacteraceae bacterium]
MPLTNFVDQSTVINAAWLNQVDVLKETIFGAASTKPVAISNLFSGSPGKLVNIASSVGGTGDAITIVSSTLNFSSDSLSIFTPTAPNTTAVTVNPNGLGPKSLVSASGADLPAGSLLANSPAITLYVLAQDKFFLLNPVITLGTTTGTFVATLTGCTVPVTFNIDYVKMGTLVMATAQTAVAQQGTSNSTGLSLTGIPAGIGAKLTPAGFASLPARTIIDNGVNKYANAFFTSATVITFELLEVVGAYIAPNIAGFTASGNKGITSGAAFIWQSAT